MNDFCDLTSSLDECNLSSLWAFSSLAFDVLNSLSFLNGLWLTYDITCVNKNLFATILRSNEAKAFL